MPLTVRRPARWSWRALLPWAVGILPLACGLGVMHWQTERNLQQQSQTAAAQVLGHVERILDNLSGAAQELLPLAGTPCEQASLALRAQVTRVAFVRSALLFQHNSLYCTSLLGEYQEALDSNDYTDGRLWLIGGNSMTPDRPLMIYRASSGDRGVLVTVDGEHLLTALRMIAPDLDVQIRVGDNWLGEDGKVREGPVPIPATASSDLSSTRYPVSVQAGFGSAKPLSMMLGQYPALLSLLLLIGVLAGGVCR